MDIKLDDNNDIVIENNTLVFTTGTDEIRQSIVERLNFFKGEWFLDLKNGTPWFQDIFGKGNRLSTISTALKSRIIDTQGVKRLQEFTLDLNNSTRELLVEMSAQTEDDTFIRINEVISI